MEPGGWLWVIIDIVGVLVLAGALAYGTYMWHLRRKDRALQRAQDEKVRENYRRGG